MLTMSYLVLARKYRPKDFSDLMVGQEPMVRTLTNAFEEHSTLEILSPETLAYLAGYGLDRTQQVLTIQRGSVDTAGMFATIIVLCGFASSAYALILLWERRFFRHRQPAPTQPASAQEAV